MGVGTREIWWVLCLNSVADSQQQWNEHELWGSNDVSWNRVWKLGVPPKVKVFWWRVLQDFLPTKSVLHHRHIEPLPFCDTSGAEAETV